MQCVLVVVNQTTINMCCVRPRRAKTSSALWRKPAISRTIHLFVELHFGLAVCLEVVFLIWHITVLCSGVNGAMSTADIFQVLSVIAWAFCHRRLASTKHQRTNRGKYILCVIITYAAFWLVLTSQTLESTACIWTCIILDKHVMSE